METGNDITFFERKRHRLNAVPQVKKHMYTKEFYLNDDGIRLHAKLDIPEDIDPDKGDKTCPLAIIIHGFTGHMEERHILEACHAMHDRQVATLRLDMYGHGKSDGLFCNHTLFKWISNALTAIDYAGSLSFVSDLYLCGHSQGGLLTILVAGMVPDKLKAIIPLSPALVILDGARKGNILGQPFDPEHIPDTIGQGDRQLSGHYVRVAQYLNAEDAIRRYPGPVLIIHGDADQTVPVAYAYEAARLYGDRCQLKIIPGDSHCYDRHCDQMSDAIRAYLDSL